jgi:outer membrane scaffolding protein for murein synthesis (MipA/OmpV family)
LFAFTTFGTADFINKDFGVTAPDSIASGLPATRLDGCYRSLGFTLVNRRYLTGNLQLVTQAGAELYDSSLQESPLARDDFEFEIGFSLLWQF